LPRGMALYFFNPLTQELSFKVQVLNNSFNGLSSTISGATTAATAGPPSWLIKAMR